MASVRAFAQKLFVHIRRCCMKKIFVIFSLLSMFVFMTACTSKNDTQVQNIPQDDSLVNDVSVDAESTPEPIYAKQIKDGRYEITVDSSSSMFRVVKCELIAENGKMQAVMTMSGKGYGMVYMGTGEEAVKATETEYIPFVLNENEEKTFTVPVEALNIETDCAAWSIKKEKWYDRTLVFKSDMIPSEALELE